MREIHIAANTKFIGGIDADAPVALDDFQRLQNFEVSTFASQTPRAGLLEHLHEGLRGAVQDWHFDGVNVDIDVVDAAGINCREQMLGGGEEHAVFHQASGITHARDVVALRFDCEIVEIDATEHDAGIRRTGYQANLALDAGVEAYAFGGSWICNSRLEHLRLKF